jgi:hypothetical protein
MWHRILLTAIERYNRNASEDIRDVKAAVNENGKRLLDLNERSEGNYKRIKVWHEQTDNHIRTVGDGVVELQQIHRSK